MSGKDYDKMPSSSDPGFEDLVPSIQSDIRYHELCVERDDFPPEYPQAPSISGPPTVEELSVFVERARHRSGLLCSDDLGRKLYLSSIVAARQHAVEVLYRISDGVDMGVPSPRRRMF